MAFEKLSREIVQLSEADSWDRAKSEWGLAYVIMLEPRRPRETCLCGHYPIREICVLRNSANHNEARVGNCCVMRFLGDLESDSIFRGLRRVRESEDRSLGWEALLMAARAGWLTDWELQFYMDTLNKRRLSAKQINKRARINSKVLRRVCSATNLSPARAEVSA